MPLSEYGFGNSAEAGNEIKPFNRQSAERDEMSERRLRSMDICPHFQDFEIEAKLNLEAQTDPEEALRTAIWQLRKNGLHFDEPVEHKTNYVIYIDEKHGGKHRKGKIVVRSQGESGFQVKQKSALPGQSSKLVMVKWEERSPVFSTIEEAEDYLSANARIVHPASHLESVVKRTSAKTTFMARQKGQPDRYYRLVSDRSEMLEQRQAADALCQLEIEYKGSNQEEEDNLEQIRMQMEQLVEILQSGRTAGRPTQDSKRAWANKQKN